MPRSCTDLNFRPSAVYGLFLMTSSAQHWIERFLFQLRTERQLSPHTASAYQHDLSEFVAYCVKQDLHEWPDVDHQHIRAFAAAEHRRGISPRSIQRRLSSLRSFFKFLIAESQLKKNPALDVRAPKAGKRLPQTVDADLMSRLLSFRTDTDLDKRDKAIMELFYSSGLRLAELVNLDVAHLDLADRTVRVLGKGNKERVLPIGRYAITALQDWLQERAMTLPADDGALFVTRGARRLTPRAIQLRVKQWALRQGIGRHLHPHLFRHSFASHLLESSQDLRGVQELLGHTNIATTQVYTHLDFQHLAKIYDQTHPRARRKT